MSELKLEAGKKYIDRRGRVYGPLIDCGANLFAEDECQPLWWGTGLVSRKEGESADMDLIAEYVPAELPDDWVTQDRVPVRVGIDEIRYPGEEFRLAKLSGFWTDKAVHGKYHGLEVRCRRKDLPLVEEVYPQYRVTYEPQTYAFVRIDDKSTLTFVNLDGTEEPKVCFPYAWEHVNGREELTEEEALAKIQKPKPATKTVKVHTVLYGSSVMLAKYVGQVLDSAMDGFKRDWKYVQILKTEEFEVTCE